MDDVLMKALDVKTREEIFKALAVEKELVPVAPAPAPQGVSGDLVRH